MKDNGLQTTLDLCPRKNQDERIRMAYNIYNAIGPSGCCHVHKVPRAGGSTALAAESINRGEPFLALVANNSIATDAFVEAAVKFSDNHDANVIHVPPNHQCLLNVDLCEQYPILKTLPVLPIPDTCIDNKGNKCDHYEECPITRILRANEMAGCVMTYSKLVALKMAAEQRPNSLARKVLNKIEKMNNIILDDVHILAQGRSVEVAVMKGWPGSRELSTEKYHAALDRDEFGNIMTVVDAIDATLKHASVTTAIDAKLEEMTKPFAYQHNKPTTINNPSCLEDDTWFIIACYNEIIKLAREISEGHYTEYNMRITDVLKLYQLMNIAFNKRLVLVGRQNKALEPFVRMVAVDRVYNLTLKKYLSKAHYARKRVIMTSATFGCYDYNELIHEKSQVRTFFMGYLGDPMKTCDKMTIFTDTTGKYGWEQKSMTPVLIELLRALDTSDVLIFATNKRVASNVEKGLNDAGMWGYQISTYWSSRSYSIDSKCRIAILLGPAWTSKAPFDAMYEDPVEAELMHMEAEQAATNNALNRVKDHMGIEPSFVFAIGIKREAMEDIISWGPGRAELGEEFLRRWKENNINDDVTKCISEYFRPGHDSDSQKESNLQVTEENVIHDQDHNTERKTINEPVIPRNISDKSRLWSTVSEKYLAKPVISSLCTVKTAIGEYRRISYNSNILNRLRSNKIYIDKVKNVRGPKIPCAEEQTEKDSHVNDVEDINILYINKQLEEKHAKYLGEVDLNVDNAEPAPDYICKVGALARFFKEELPTWYKQVTNRMQILDGLCYRTNAYALQNEDGEGYCKCDGDITDELLQAHLDGTITMGVYTLGKENQVSWMCFDIDAHKDINDSIYDVMAKNNTAEKRMEEICGFLDMMHVPFLLEASGSPHSYHIWIYLKPVKAIIAREFGKAILKELGIKKMEVFPKQASIKSTHGGYGNLVKLPFAFHRKHKIKTSVWHPELKQFVTDFETMTVGAIDISAFVPEREVSSTAPGYIPTTTGVRDIFRWALDQDLSGEEGHYMRIAVTREFWCSGLTDYAAIAKLFANQPDYDFEYTCGKVADILKSEFNKWKWETLAERCPSIVAAYMAGKRYEV